jgi:hypothetical protein
MAMERDQQNERRSATEIPIGPQNRCAEASESIYKHMIDYPEKALWAQILQTSEMRMSNSRQTNAIAFDRMEETRKAIRRSQESIRRTDEFIRRVMPISK